MPALLEVQRMLRAQLLGPQPVGVHPGDAEILQVYRHTASSTLVNALRLSFPVIARLVGTEFFEGAAREFIALNAPRSAYLNNYGAGFASFLAQFAPAAGLPYLSDVAHLEWAVNQALHAADVPRLELQRLTELEQAALPTVVFSIHPSICLLKLEFPADDIWRAVLDADDVAMARIDLQSGPVHLLIGRERSGVQVRRLDPWGWELTRALSAGRSLQAALADCPVPSEAALNTLLADHLSSGRFIDFTCAGDASP